MTIGTPVFYPSSPIAIRDGTFDRVSTVPGLNKTFKARTMPGQDDLTPYACVWYSGERTEPNGDANVGAPSFKHALSLVIDVITRAGSEGDLDAQIVDLVETIRATLMTDPSWIALFEGIEKIDTRYAYPKEAENFFVQAIVEIEVTFRSEWPPYLPNDLKTVVVTVEPTRPPWTCVYCGTGNAGSAPCCSTCGAPAPEPTTFVTEIDLDQPSC